MKQLLFIIAFVNVATQLFSQNLTTYNGLYFPGSGLHSDGLPNARLIEYYGMRYNSPDTRRVLSSKPTVLIGYIGDGRYWGNGSLMVQEKVGVGTTVPDGKLSLFGTSGEVKLHIGNSDPGGYTAIRFAESETGYGLATMHRFNANYSHPTPAPAFEPSSIVFWEGVGNMNYGSKGNFKFYTGALSAENERMRITENGNIGIGTPTPCSDCKLDVDGKIRSEEVVVEVVNGPDYVFEDNYELRTLAATRDYIEQNHHLPEVPSAKEMEENGVGLSEMNMLLLKKVEELTLYLLEQDAALKSANKRIFELEQKISQ